MISLRRNFRLVLLLSFSWEPTTAPMPMPVAALPGAEGVAWQKVMGGIAGEAGGSRA